MKRPVEQQGKAFHIHCMLCGVKEGWRGANYNSVGGRRLLETGSSE
jgi:hypothetical protein